jgi:hypothetical protein
VKPFRIPTARSPLVLTLALLALPLLIAACSTAPDGLLDAQAASARYRVTFTNLTTGQPFTPPLIATHQSAVALFEVGQVASEGIREIAENGNLAPALAALGASNKVAETVVAVGAVPPLLPQATVSAEIGAQRGARFVSFASMLICSNDGFTGLDRVKLPEQLGGVVEVYANAYDAGTELNSEDFADIVPPCQGLIGVGSDDPGTGMSDPALAEGGVIAAHPGVAGGNDLLPGVHGWSDPVAMVVIERID